MKKTIIAFGILTALLIAMLFLLSACSTYSLQSPLKARTLDQPAINTEQVISSVRGFIDKLCVPPVVPDTRGDFGAGLMDAYFLGRQQQMFTAQQLADLQAFKDFCKKDPALRTDYEYGWLAGRFADDAVRESIPFLGRDALAIGSYLGLLP